MFDDDDLFDLTDDPFEWDLLLDDDELERDRKKRRDKKTQDDASKKQDKRRRGLFGGALWLTDAPERLYTRHVLDALRNEDTDDDVVYRRPAPGRYEYLARHGSAV